MLNYVWDGVGAIKYIITLHIDKIGKLHHHHYWLGLIWQTNERHETNAHAKVFGYTATRRNHIIQYTTFFF